MTSASEQAAAFLTGANTADERPLETRGATGEYARLRELVAKDDLSDAETEEFHTLAEKRRAGTLEGSPARSVRKRPSVAGEREDGVSTSSTPKTASAAAAAQLLGRSS